MWFSCPSDYPVSLVVSLCVIDAGNARCFQDRRLSTCVYNYQLPSWNQRTAFNVANIILTPCKNELLLNSFESRKTGCKCWVSCSCRRFFQIIFYSLYMDPDALQWCEAYKWVDKRMKTTTLYREKVSYSYSAERELSIHCSAHTLLQWRIHQNEYTASWMEPFH